MAGNIRGLDQIIEDAVFVAVQKALNGTNIGQRRLVTAKEAALFLCLSERELYNMIASKELPQVRHGRRLMLDVRDLERWIEVNKK